MLLCKTEKVKEKGKEKEGKEGGKEEELLHP